MSDTSTFLIALSCLVSFALNGVLLGERYIPHVEKAPCSVKLTRTGETHEYLTECEVQRD